MSRAMFMAIGATAVALACVVLLELAGAATHAEAPPPARVARATAAPKRATPPAQIDRWVATILARPIFSASRRPVPGEVASADPATPDSLPRLSGVMVDRNSRRVIFAGANGGKPIVAEAGAHVGGFTVESIEPDGVTVTGPGGKRVLHPTFEAGGSTLGTTEPAAPPRAVVPPPGNSSLEQLLRRGLPPTTGGAGAALGPPA